MGTGAWGHLESHTWYCQLTHKSWISPILPDTSRPGSIQSRVHVTLSCRVSSSSPHSFPDLHHLDPGQFICRIFLNGALLDRSHDSPAVIRSGKNRDVAVSAHCQEVDGVTRPLHCEAASLLFVTTLAGTVNPPFVLVPSAMNFLHCDTAVVCLMVVTRLLAGISPLTQLSGSIGGLWVLPWPTGHRDFVTEFLQVGAHGGPFNMPSSFEHILEGPTHLAPESPSPRSSGFLENGIRNQHQVSPAPCC